MSDDTVTRTTHQSWFSRVAGAFFGIFLGVALFFGSFFLLAWNEGRAIHREKTLDLGAKQVVSISADEPLAENNGKLVHFSGEAEAGKPVVDPVFGIRAEALKLRRNVEMYQWKESEKSETRQKLGGGEETVTTYSYSKAWASEPVDSSKFQKPEGHRNPGTMPAQSASFTAAGIHVGKFLLPSSLSRLIDNYEPRVVTQEEAALASDRFSKEFQLVEGGVLYLGQDAAAPGIGDLRITFEVAPYGPVSIIAGQAGSTLEPFAIKNLGAIELLQTGVLSAKSMFEHEKASNTMLTWILRIAGFFMMLFGLVLITNILSVLASVIPFLGDIVGAGTGLLAFAVALPLSIVTIAISWIAYRPLVGVPLLILAVVCSVFAIRRVAGSRKQPSPGNA